MPNPRTPSLVGIARETVRNYRRSLDSLDADSDADVEEVAASLRRACADDPSLLALIAATALTVNNPARTPRQTKRSTKAAIRWLPLRKSHTTT